MTVTISNEIIEEYLRVLSKSGLYGFTKADAARRLIEEQLRTLIKERPFLFANK